MWTNPGRAPIVEGREKGSHRAIGRAHRERGVARSSMRKAWEIGKEQERGIARSLGSATLAVCVCVWGGIPKIVPLTRNCPRMGMPQPDPLRKSAHEWRPGLWKLPSVHSCSRHSPGGIAGAATSQRSPSISSRRLSKRSRLNSYCAAAAPEDLNFATLAAPTHKTDLRAICGNRAAGGQMLPR